MTMPNDESNQDEFYGADAAGTSNDEGGLTIVDADHRATRPKHVPAFLSASGEHVTTAWQGRQLAWIQIRGFKRRGGNTYMTGKTYRGDASQCESALAAGCDLDTVWLDPAGGVELRDEVGGVDVPWDDIEEIYL